MWRCPPDPEFDSVCFAGQESSRMLVESPCFGSIPYLGLQCPLATAKSSWRHVQPYLISRGYSPWLISLVDSTNRDCWLKQPNFWPRYPMLNGRCPPVIFEGSLEVKLPTIWRDEKQSRAEAERRGRLEERRSEEKEKEEKKIQMREKVGKSRNTVFFQ